MKITAKQKCVMQREGVKFGCHVELNVGELPDDCVKDYGADGDCIYARRHRTREACKYWQPVDEVKSP
jgi:hypothetical protein